MQSSFFSRFAIFVTTLVPAGRIVAENPAKPPYIAIYNLCK